MSQSKTIGERIADLRRERNLQQDEFAERIGVSRQALSFWETGKQIPRADKILEICMNFGVDANYFYADEPAKGEVEIGDKSATSLQENNQEKNQDNNAKTNEVAKGSTQNNKKITLAKIYEIWRLLLGWLFVVIGFGVLICIFIIGLSPNVNGTTVRLWLIDWTGVSVILLVCLVVFSVSQIIRTILYFSKNKRGDHHEE